MENNESVVELMEIYGGLSKLRPILKDVPPEKWEGLIEAARYTIELRKELEESSIPHEEWGGAIEACKILLDLKRSYKGGSLVEALSRNRSRIANLDTQYQAWLLRNVTMLID